MADQIVQFPQPPRPGLVRTVGNAEMMAAENQQIQAQREMEIAQAGQQFTGLSGYIRAQWDMMVRHRNTINGWSDRLLLPSGRCRASTIRRSWQRSGASEAPRFTPG